MIIRATSDLHLSQATAPLVFAALDELYEDAKMYGGFTVLAGDIFDQPNTVHMPTWQKLRSLLRNWPGDAIYVIAGNHDQYPGGTCLGGLEVGKSRIVTTPYATRIGTMVPYVDPSEFKRAQHVVAPGWKTPHILWCHQGFKGAYMNRMVRDRDGVSCLDIPSDHIVVSGHYHMPQNLGRIIYCGSPYQKDFGEEGQEKGWLKWEDAITHAIPERIAYEFDAPRHYTLTWRRGEELIVPDVVREHDRIRIRTDMTRAEAAAFEGELTKAGLNGVPIIYASADGKPQVADLGEDPEVAAVDYMMSLTAGDVRQPDPVQMEVFAKQEGIL